MAEAFPEILSKEGNYWFLRHIFANVTRKNKHFALLMCGESGAGKSWDSLAISKALYPAMKPSESVAFSPLQFLEITERKHPMLFPCIIDDAGLSAFSGDALTSQVKNLSKIAQSIRHKNWQIIFNLPNIDLIAKSVRITNHYYAEPLWIDYKEKISYIKFQRLRINKDKIIPRNLKTRKRVLNEVTGYMETKKEKHLMYGIPAPASYITDEYEKLKEEFMDNYRFETAESMRIAKAKELGKDSGQTYKAADTMRSCIDEYTTAKGSANVAKIMDEFRIGQTAARLAYNMAMMPKDKKAVDEGKIKLKQSLKNKGDWTQVTV